MADIDDLKATFAIPPPTRLIFTSSWWRSLPSSPSPSMAKLQQRRVPRVNGRGVQRNRRASRCSPLSLLEGTHMGNRIREVSLCGNARLTVPEAASLQVFRTTVC